MHLPKPEGGDFELTPAGTFTARCVKVIDLGSHKQEYQGEDKGMKRLIMIGFELPTELRSDGTPHTISKRYTFSTHEKATMRKDLEAWRGAKFNDDDFGPGGFDIKNLLGVPCTMTIMHADRENKTYANIANIGKAMKGMQIPPQAIASIYFSMEPDEFDARVFNDFSDKLKEFIRPTPEFERAMDGQSPDPARDPNLEKSSFDDADIPF